LVATITDKNKTHTHTHPSDKQLTE